MERLTFREPKRLASALLWLVLACGLCGCQSITEPVTGRRQFIFTTPAMEKGMSESAWRDIQAKEKPSANQERTAAVKRVGAAISAAAARPDFEWEFHLFASKQANAFCLPDGKIAVYEGLFKHLANDAELAAVVGHEVAHAIARHGGERMTQALVINLGALGLSYAMKDKEAASRERWLAAYTGVSTLGYILPYSRTHEYAADEIGLILMAKAGYSPQAPLTFWSKFAAAGKSKKVPEFLSTHPVGEKRIARLESILHKGVLEYEMAPTPRGLGRTYGK